MFIFYFSCLQERCSIRLNTLFIIFSLILHLIVQHKLIFWIPNFCLGYCYKPNTTFYWSYFVNYISHMELVLWFTFWHTKKNLYIIWKVATSWNCFFNELFNTILLIYFLKQEGILIFLFDFLNWVGYIFCTRNQFSWIEMTLLLPKVIFWRTETTFFNPKTQLLLIIVLFLLFATHAHSYTLFFLALQLNYFYWSTTCTRALLHYIKQNYYSL